MKKMKRLTALVFAGLLTAGSVGVLGACGKKENDPNTIYVKMYNGGFGTEWIAKAGQEYTAKTGTKIAVKTYKTEGMTPQNLKSDNNELFFLQDAKYYNYVESGVLADISTAITGANPYESDKTIYSKMNADQQDFLAVDGKYYGLTHYVGNWGLVYDVDLFNKENYYFREGKDQNTDYKRFDTMDEQAAQREIGAMFVNSTNPKKANGPDGVYGTADDGLPATYADFWILCKRIRNTENIPLVWSGTQRGTYLTSFMMSLIADNLGKQDLLKTFNFNIGDKVENLANFDADGNIINFNGEATFNGSNGYEIYRQEAYYQGLEFIRELMQGYQIYGNGYGTDDGFQYTSAQDVFIRSIKETNKIAMLIEGQWWENEANKVFISMENDGEMYSRKNRNFGWMPLPKASVEQVGEGKTMLSNQDAICVVRKGISDDKLAKIIDFIQFLNTDEQLVKFTQETSAMRGLNYKLEEAEMASLTPFGRSVVTSLQTSSIVYPEARDGEYRKNTLYDVNVYGRFVYSYKGIEAQQPSLLWSSDDGATVSAAQYLKRLYDAYKAGWVNKEGQKV